MLDSSHIPDMAAAIGAAALLLGWLLTARLMSGRAAGLRSENAALKLELAGAQYRLDQATTQIGLLAHHDPLTGLLVRSEMQRAFHAALAISRRSQTVFGVILMDLPSYKSIVAQHGPEIAERALAAFGQRLRTVTRDMDTVARLGDTQFGALLPRLNDADEVTIVIRKLRAECERSVTLSGLPGTLHVETAFGHACYPADGDDWASIMKAADERLARNAILYLA